MKGLISDFVYENQFADYLANRLNDVESARFNEKLNSSNECRLLLNQYIEQQNEISLITSLSVSESHLAELARIDKGKHFYFKNPISFYTDHPKKFYIETSVVFASIVLVMFFTPWKTILNYDKFKNDSPTIAGNFLVTDEPVLSDLKLTSNQSSESLLTGPFSGLLWNSGEKQNVPEICGYSKDGNCLDVQSKIVIVEAEAIDEKAVEKSFEKSIKEVKVKNGPKGVLYRAYMSLHDLESKKVTIVNLIKELGGEKAGASELGYVSSRGKTFHLKIPAENQFKLIGKLQSMGKIKVDKERHWRQMPDGVARFLLSIEDLDAKQSWQ